MSKISVLAYLNSQITSVGSRRSRALSLLLRQQGHDVHIFHQNTFSPNDSQLTWSIKLAWHFLFNRYDYLYITCGPYQILGFLPLFRLIFRKKTIITDFRDPLSINMQDKVASPLSRAVLRPIGYCLEHAAYHLSNYFVVCTDGMHHIYSEIFGDSSKLVLALNGHDIDEPTIRELAAARENNHNGKIRAVCLGKFFDAPYNYRNKAIRFLEYLRERKSHSIPVPLKLTLIGGEIDQDFIDLIDQLGLADDITIVPRMDYVEAIRYASSFDVGIAIIPDERTVFGTKLFDYIAIGLPVLDIFSETACIRTRFSNHLFTLDNFDQFTPASIEERLSYSRQNTMRPLIKLFGDTRPGTQ